MYSIEDVHVTFIKVPKINTLTSLIWFCLALSFHIILNEFGLKEVIKYEFGRRERMHFCFCWFSDKRIKSWQHIDVGIKCCLCVMGELPFLPVPKNLPLGFSNYYHLPLILVQCSLPFFHCFYLWKQFLYIRFLRNVYQNMFPSSWICVVISVSGIMVQFSFFPFFLIHI